MYELLGQLLAAIFGSLSGSLKPNKKTKYWVSLTAGLVFFIFFSIAFYFDSNPEKTGTIYGIMLISIGIGIWSFLGFLLDDFLKKRKLRKQQEQSDKDKNN